MASFVILDAQPDVVSCEVTLDDGTVFAQQIRGDAKATLANVSAAVSAAAQTWMGAGLRQPQKIVDPAIVDAVKQKTPIPLVLVKP